MGCEGAGAETAIGVLHLGQATFLPISFGGTFKDASQFWQAILILSLGAGAAMGALKPVPSGWDAAAAGTSMGPLHLGHLIRLP